MTGIFLKESKFEYMYVESKSKCVSYYAAITSKWSKVERVKKMKGEEGRKSHYL